MNATVDADQAKMILRQAIDEVVHNNWTPTGPLSDSIQFVILGKHKTYRYILLNGLLAKATNERCNPLVLQAGSQLSGAFDARSLCHNVLVPIERELLGDRLGASNEPFLNKPARFTELSTSNAVRRGMDTEILKKTIYTLSKLDTANDANVSLKDAIYWVFQRPSRDINDYLSDNTDKVTQSALIEFAKDLISVSVEGETCALLAGAAFDVLASVAERDLTVRAHKVNQAGSSSKEVSDIDVYNDKLIYTAEVKDKQFSAQDVEHAVAKVAEASHNTLLFIKGPRGKLTGDSEENQAAIWRKKGFNLYFVNIIDFFTSLLSISPTFSHQDLIAALNTHADTAKVKDETFEHLTECIKKQSW